jgi:hypothetical protein
MKAFQTELSILLQLKHSKATGIVIFETIGNNN